MHVRTHVRAHMYITNHRAEKNKQNYSEMCGQKQPGREKEMERGKKNKFVHGLSRYGDTHEQIHEDSKVTKGKLVQPA